MSSALDAEGEVGGLKLPVDDLVVVFDDDDDSDDVHLDDPDLDEGWPLTDGALDAVYEAIGAVIDGAPTTVQALAEAFTAPAGPLASHPVDAAADVIEQLLSDLPGVWEHGGNVARIENLLEGRVFTHRLTALDLSFDGLEADPDLAVVGSAPNTSTLADGTELRSTEDPGTGWHGFVGPSGWLAAFQVGDLVALRYAAGRWSLEAAAVVGDGLAEVEALLADLAPAMEAGRGDELLSPVLNVLSTDDALFRHPVAPASELLVDAGLLRDGPFIGPADRIWYPYGATLDLNVVRVASRHEIVGCCMAALQRVATRWRAHQLGLDSLDGVPSAAEAAAALDHDSVPTALVDLMHLPRSADRAASFVHEVLSAAPEKVGPLALAGAVADRLGHHREAEERYRQALAIDPTTRSALTGLGWLAFDRGDLGTARRLLQRSLSPDHRFLKMIADLVRALPEPGRNAPCPCGSGRKFKACHRDQAPVPPETRPLFLLAKLMRADTADSLSMLRLQLMAADLDYDDPLLRKLASELHMFDPGNASAYRRLRGELLPEEERALLDRIIDTPIRLVEVASLPADGGVVFDDAVSGESIECRLLPGTALDPGAVGLARIIDGELIGTFGPVPRPENREAIRTLLAQADGPAHPGLLHQLLAGLNPDH